MLHTADLIVYSTPFTDGCAIMRTKTQCFYLRLPYNVATNLLNCSAIFIALERLFATFNYGNYEGAYRYVGYCLLASQLLLSAVINGIMYSQTRLDYSLVYYCQGTSTSNYMWTIYPFAFLLVLQFVSVMIFETASRKNKSPVRLTYTPWHYLLYCGLSAKTFLIRFVAQFTAIVPLASIAYSMSFDHSGIVENGIRDIDMYELKSTTL
ncbi:unnamed protein product [Cylicocyclus nassatus]|uniref:Uncharacterized protein n=1 Tax=Cylicocyclus nassatus TaxID=53992 RepID=A0AA36DKS9_CYLNA|nr:unnamed protein product [Cylicocyclus nassatus]